MIIGHVRKIFHITWIIFYNWLNMTIVGNYSIYLKKGTILQTHEQFRDKESILIQRLAVCESHLQY